jgi:hypothetical protein
MKKLIVILGTILLLGTVSSYFEVVCINEETGGGIKVWNVGNLSNQNRTLIEEIITADPNLQNCTFKDEPDLETQMSWTECKSHFLYIISVLNNNIWERNDEIASLKRQRTFSTGILIVIIIFVSVREIINRRRG